MPFNGSGTFTVYTPGNPIANGDTSNATYFNNTMTDFATGLSNTMTKDGQGVPTANIPMGNNKLTGLAAGTAATDAINYTQAQNGATNYLTSVSGTNTITASLTNLASYTAGLTVRFTAAGANTGAATLSINGLSAINVVRADGVALTTGDILSSGTYEAVYDGTSFKLQGSVSASQVASVKQIQPITASVASNALTISLSPTSLDFRSTTLGSGTVTTVSVPSTISVVVPSTATLGTINALLSRLAVIAINNAGTVELAVVNSSGGNDLTESGLITTTAIAGGSNSASVFYSTTGRASVAYRVVGYVESTQATAGTWATSPSLIQGNGGNAIQGKFNYIKYPVVATTSGTSIDPFSGATIPTWAKRITLTLNAVSQATGDFFVVRLGTSGGLISAGYAAGWWTNGTNGNNVTGFEFEGRVDAAASYSGKVVYELQDASTNTWVAAGNVFSSNGDTFGSAGIITLSGLLTQMRLTTLTPVTLDAGSISVMVEG